MTATRLLAAIPGAEILLLQAKVDKLIANQSVCLQGNDAAAISHIITEVSPVVEDRFPLNSPCSDVTVLLLLFYIILVMYACDS